MSEAILLTGKRGQGKTLTAMSIIQDYMSRGCVVATNINLYLENLLPAWSSQTAYRLPDLPTAEDFLNLPVATSDITNESTYGLIALDETSVFLNAQTWNEKGRKELRAFLAQSRKFGWDLLLIAQNHKQVDSQIRESLIELQGKTKRTDKIGIPFLTPLAQWFGFKLRLPKFHIATFRYGFQENAPKSFTKITSGDRFYKAYDTTQVISILNEPTAPYSFLSPFHLKGRYMKPSKLYRPFIVKGFMGGILIASVAAFTYIKSQPEKLIEQPLKPSPVIQPIIDSKPLDSDKPKIIITGTYTANDNVFAILSDGSQQKTSGFSFEKGVSKYKIGADWFEVQK